MLFKKKDKIIRRRLIETYVVRLKPASESSRPSKLEKRGRKSEPEHANPVDNSK